MKRGKKMFSAYSLSPWYDWISFLSSTFLTHFFFSFQYQLVLFGVKIILQEEQIKVGKKDGFNIKMVCYNILYQRVVN